MKGVLRIMMLFYTSDRMQPWLLGIGSAALLATQSQAYAALCRRLPWAPMWTALVSIISLSLIGVAVALGSVGIRWVSSQRLLKLIPLARARLFLGLLLAPQLPAALIAIGVVLQHPAVTHGWGSPADTAVIVCSSAVLLTLWLFMASRSTLFAVLPATLGLFLPALTRSRLIRGGITGLPLVSILGYAALIAIFIFASWYLRAPYIAPPKSRSWEGSSFTKIRPVKTLQTSKNSAIDAYLLEAPSLSSATRSFLTTSVLFNALFVLVFGVSWYGTDGRLGFMSAPLMTLVTTATLGNQWVMKISQRARRIWLSSGESRLGVFRLCERLSWRFLVSVGFPLWFICAMEWVLLPQGKPQPYGMRTGLYLLAVMIELNVCGLYLGLMAFRNRSGDQIPFVLLLMTVYLTLTMHLFFRPDTPLASLLEPSIALALLLAAAALRLFARARWQDIDWLNCRPKRQAERAIPH